MSLISKNIPESSGSCNGIGFCGSWKKIVFMCYNYSRLNVRKR
jgi:hypothetical protein